MLLANGFFMQSPSSLSRREFLKRSTWSFCAVGAASVAFSRTWAQVDAIATAEGTATFKGVSAGAEAFIPDLSYSQVETTERVLALTFDDGPHPKLTPRLLDLLAERQLKATFYVIGRNVRSYPEIAARIVEEGHEIANHTQTHPQLSRLSAARVSKELQGAHEAILEGTGVVATTMRPPFGAVNQRVRQVARSEFDYTTIMWSVDPQDWRYRNAERVTAQLLAGAAPGAIMLCHDIHASTIDAMPATLDGLMKKGFELATVSELMRRPSRPPAASALKTTGSPAVEIMRSEPATDG